MKRIEVSVKLFNGKSKYQRGSSETISIVGRGLPSTYDVADSIYDYLNRQVKAGFPVRKVKERVVRV